MTKADGVSIRFLTARDVDTMRALNHVFSEAFEEDAADPAEVPTDAELGERLAKPHVLALVAETGGAVVGGITGYVLDKLGERRPEVYLYDLAVAEPFRRRGIATALVEALRAEATRRGASVVFVQADPEDAPAVALYHRFAARTEVYQFDVPVDDGA